MSYKENERILRPFAVKAEPEDAEVAPLARSSSWNKDAPEVHRGVKSEMGTAKIEALHVGLNPAVLARLKDENYVAQPLAAVPITKFYRVYDNPQDINYVPEDALKEGLNMVRTLETAIKQVQLGSLLRQEVWSREVESLQSQGAPTTLIAVCGATGAGKSSILNAILDDNIVPTSGMRACTAVVTELAYHDKNTIDADVSFLSELEWKQELAVLLHDLIDEDGHIKRSNDLKSDAGVAWQKVHAVYPSISQEKLVSMTAEQIIAHDAKIARILGVTKKIVARDSKSFALEIAKYIDSKDQKRGDKKSKKDKKKEKSRMDKIREAAGVSKDKHKKTDPDAPALWPLIRQVNVRCRAAALSTGAVLVDLPGVADANVARNNIAKNYMKKCDCIWILAPITRAVDDKTARDLLGDAFKMQLMNGNYADHAITFIASKCDDISCSEVIRALQLEDDPALEDIEERLDEYRAKLSQCKKSKSASEKLAKALQKEVQDGRDMLKEYREHREALRNGEAFVPKLTANTTSSKKRKNSRGGKSGSPKRRRSTSESDDSEDLASSDESSDSDSDSESDSDAEDDDESESSDDSDSDMGGPSSAASDEGDGEDEETTEAVIDGKIAEWSEKLKTTRAAITAARKDKKDAMDEISSLEKHIAKVQREKNAFCSLKRSEFSKDVLKEDFRVGLKDLDDAAAEEQDPDGFNPTENLRDYDAIDLPVFTCSSRDYVRLKRQVKGDGDPVCFTNAVDTGIPALQQWCHQLTISSRERAAKNFLAHLKTFATSVESYVAGIGEVTHDDRELLRDKWESPPGHDFVYPWDNAHDSESDEEAEADPFEAILGMNRFGGLYQMPKPVRKLDEQGRPIGITPRLTAEFETLVQGKVQDLQEHFKDGLEEKCQTGAVNAANSAVATSDELAATSHWQTYRATLRRLGSWRRDLNMELIAPFTRNIAHSWGKVFETDMFSPLEAAVDRAINKLVGEVEKSAALGLKDRTRIQGDQCLEEARVALGKLLDTVRVTLNDQQKEVSRCMAPHVQRELTFGYNLAMDERGRGSVARQKVIFHDFIDQVKDEIFDGGAEVIMTRLTEAAEKVGEVLRESLRQLAQKVEVSLSVLWEGAADSPQQERARKAATEIVEDVLDQIDLWVDAEQLREAASPVHNEEDVDMN